MSGRGRGHFDEHFTLTNRLRSEATDHLLSAGRAAGVRRFVAQSFAGWPYARTGGPVKREEDPLDSTPVASMTRTLSAIRRLEHSVTSADWLDGVILRYGFLYGPRSRGQAPVPRAPVRRRLAAGEAAVAMMTDVRGASNDKAKRELGWQPAHPSWRQSLARAA